MRFAILLSLIAFISCKPLEKNVEAGKSSKQAEGQTSITIDEFEFIRNITLHSGKYTVWSNLYGGGLELKYLNEDVKIIYCPSKFRLNSSEFIHITWKTKDICFMIRPKNGSVQILNNRSDSNHDKQATELEVCKLFKELIIIIQSSPSKEPVFL